VRVTLFLHTTADGVGRTFFVADHASFTVFVVHMRKIIAVESNGGIGAVEIAKETTFAFFQI
jgi:hypothetical protein